MSKWIGNLPIAFYNNPTKAKLLVDSKKEANEIIMHYDGYAPTYMGLGQWRLRVHHVGAGVYELRCQMDNENG